MKFLSVRGGVWEQWLLKGLFWGIPSLEGRKAQLPTPGFPQISSLVALAEAGAQGRPSCTQKPGQGSVGVFPPSLRASLAWLSVPVLGG